MAKDRVVIPGIPTDAARVIIDRMREQDERLALLERKAGRPGIVTADVAAKVGEFLNIEGPADLITVILPESTQARRNARITLAFRNSNPVRIVAVNGTVNGDAFVLNDRPGTYDAICDGLGGWSVQVGVSEAGSGAGGGGGGGGVTYGTPVSVGIANADGVATSVARSDHVHKDRIATGSADGYLSRFVYANSGSAAVGTTFAGETVAAVPASWTTSADVPDGNWLEFDPIGGGGGGAAGAAVQTSGGASFASGGGGGGGGAKHPTVRLSRADVLAQLPLAFTLSLGGAGGTAVAQAVNGGTTGTNGVSGVTSTVVGATLSIEFGAGGGGAGGVNGGAAGGWGGGGGGILGSAGVASATATGGNPLPGLVGAAATVAGFSTFGGAGGGDDVTGGANQPGGTSLFGGAGGGGGGKAAASGGAALIGAVGGFSVYGAGGGGGGGSATETGAPASIGGGAGGAGGVGAPQRGGAGGAGGASAQAAASSTATAGAPGAFPGGGGGGGGAALSTTSGTATSGAGGAGGDAALVITAFA